VEPEGTLHRPERTDAAPPEMNARVNLLRSVVLGESKSHNRDNKEHRT